mmetsp:Transcript_49260/g.73457  ORF Transcript_49260/g.73457 Transcript_49260/m.73457 type:complete len:288 (-) Transcript_49260:75-938(-)
MAIIFARGRFRGYAAGSWPAPSYALFLWIGAAKTTTGDVVTQQLLSRTLVNHRQARMTGGSYPSVNRICISCRSLNNIEAEDGEEAGLVCEIIKQQSPIRKLTLKFSQESASIQERILTTIAEDSNIQIHELHLEHPLRHTVESVENMYGIANILPLLPIRQFSFRLFFNFILLEARGSTSAKERRIFLEDILADVLQKAEQIVNITTMDRPTARGRLHSMVDLLVMVRGQGFINNVLKISNDALWPLLLAKLVELQQNSLIYSILREKHSSIVTSDDHPLVSDHER